GCGPRGVSAGVQALPQLQGPAKFGGWLCAITRHRARRGAARDGRSEATETSQLDRLILAHSQELAAHPADEDLRHTEHTVVYEALMELPPEHRTALLLYYYEEWPVAQIAGFLSLPHTTIKWRLHQGRKLLGRRLTELLEDKPDERKQHEPGDTAHPPPAA